MSLFLLNMRRGAADPLIKETMEMKLYYYSKAFRGFLVLAILGGISACSHGAKEQAMNPDADRRIAQESSMRPKGNDVGNAGVDTDAQASRSKSDLQYAKQLIQEVRLSKKISRHEDSLLDMALSKLNYVEAALEEGNDTQSHDAKFKACLRKASDRYHRSIELRNGPSMEAAAYTLDQAASQCIYRYAKNSSFNTCTEALALVSDKTRYVMNFKKICNQARD